MNKTWSEREIVYLRQNYLLLKDSELAAHISKMRGKKLSEGAIQIMRVRLNLIKPIKGRPHKDK